MNQIERRDKGMAYVCDDEAFAQQAECRKILQQLNFMDRSDFDGIKEVVKQLGNPCKVIKTITEADRKKLFKDEEIDAEAWDDIVVNGFGGEG